MPQQADLLNIVNTLPQKYFSEIISFLRHLQHKAQQEAAEAECETIAAREWVNPLLGLGKTMGSTLTLERFREMQQEEIAREIENDERLWGNK